jgi:hypothetical protein
MMSDDFTKKSGEMLAEESYDNPPANGVDKDAQQTQELVGKLTDLDASVIQRVSFLLLLVFFFY